MATAAPSPPPPAAKGRQRVFTVGQELSLPCAVLAADIVQPRLAKQVAAKIATAPNQMLLLLLSCLGESVVELSGQVGILPSQLYLQPLSLGREYFPCCPRHPPTTTMLGLRTDVSWSIPNSLPI